MEKIGPNKASPSPPPPYFMQTSPPAYNAYPSQPYSEQAALVDKCISEKGKHQPKMEIVMQNYAAESSPQQPQPPIPKDSSSKSTRQMHSSTPSSHGCVVDQCCCCCTLRTGSLIIGMLSLIGNVVVACGLGYLLIRNTGYSGPNALDLVLWILCGITALQMVSSILLLTGIAIKQAGLIQQYVYMSLILLVAGIVGNMVEFSSNFKSLSQLVISSCLQIYYIVVIRSYAISVKEEARTAGAVMA